QHRREPAAVVRADQRSRHRRPLGHRGRQLPSCRGHGRARHHRRNRRHGVSSCPRNPGGIEVTDTEYRIEHDTMGEVRVPVNALYGAQTQRAVENVPISGSGLESTQIAALARIKKAAALANKQLGTLDGAIADAIAAAADQVASGAHDGEFPVDTYQTGSGTSSNMNMNEVLATLATGILGSAVHPNDHVNASQSS